MLVCQHDQLRLSFAGDDHYHVTWCSVVLALSSSSLHLFASCVCDPLDVCAPAVASTTVACTCTPVDVMLDVGDVCTLTSRLVAVHLVSSLEALTAVAVARLSTLE